MPYLLMVDNLEVWVKPKKIRNLRLVLCPPDGLVRLSAPPWISKARICAFVRSKMAWIEKHRARIQAQSRAARREFVDQEIHQVWGRPCTLCLHPNSGRKRVELAASTLHLYLPSAATREKVIVLLYAWYKELVLQRGWERLEYWRGHLGIPPTELSVRRMKSRYGSCAPMKQKIVLNSELARAGPECLDYVLVHELVHFFIPNHGPEFWRLLGNYLPEWQSVRLLLRSLALGDSF